MSTAAAPSDFDFLDLSYHPDLQTPAGRWLRAVTFQELRQGFAAALALGLARQATRGLADVRRRAELAASSSAWVAQHPLPAAAQAPATLRAAYLLSPMRAQDLRRDAGLRAAAAAAHAPTQPYRLTTFIDEGPAVLGLLEEA